MRSVLASEKSVSSSTRWALDASSSRCRTPTKASRIRTRTGATRMATSFVPTFKFFSIASLEYLVATRRHTFRTHAGPRFRTSNPRTHRPDTAFLEEAAHNVSTPGFDVPVAGSIPLLNIDRIVAA
jgi:hypothetical protein